MTNLPIDEDDDAPQGSCECCGDMVFESSASGSAAEAGLVMHRDCVGPSTRAHELPSMRG